MKRVFLLLYSIAVLFIIIASFFLQYQDRRDQRMEAGDLQDTDVFVQFYDVEQPETSVQAYRWSDAEKSSVRFWNPTPFAANIVRLEMFLPAGQEAVRLATSQQELAVDVSASARTFHLLFPPTTQNQFTLSIRSPRYSDVPADDKRQLGVVVSQVQLVATKAPWWSLLLSAVWLFPQLALSIALLAWIFRDSPKRVLGYLAVAVLALWWCRGQGSGATIALATFLFVGNLALLGVKLFLAMAARFRWLSPVTDRHAYVWMTLVFVGVAVLFFRSSIEGDGVGYYAYARSLLFDHDLDFANEFVALQLPIADNRIPATNYVNNPWSVGPSLVWFPFLAVTKFLLALLPANPLWPNDGFSEPFALTVTLVTVLSGLVFMGATYRLCRRWMRPSAAILAVITIFLGSSLLYYVLRKGSYAHAFSAASVALMLLALVRLSERESWQRWLVLGASIGLMALIYWVNLLLLLPVLVLVFQRLLPLLLDRQWSRLWVLARFAALGALASLLVFLPQLLIWRVLYGSFFAQPPTTPTLQPTSHLLDMLLQPYGLIRWTPALFVGLCGLVLLWKRSRWWSISLIAASLIFLIYNAYLSDWDGSAAYGLRRLTSLSAFGALGLGCLYQALLARQKGLLVATFSALSVLWQFLIFVRFTDLRFPAEGYPLDLQNSPLRVMYLTRDALPFGSIPKVIVNSYCYQMIEDLLASGNFKRLGAMLIALTAVGCCLGLGYAVLRAARRVTA